MQLGKKDPLQLQIKQDELRINIQRLIKSKLNPSNKPFKFRNLNMKSFYNKITTNEIAGTPT